MTRRPEDTEPLPAPAKASDERVDIRPGYTPDVFKTKGAQSNGEANAVYQGKPHAPHSGADTQELQPAVVIDQTRKEGFSGREIRAIVEELEVERQRGKKTVVIEAAPAIPKQRAGVIVLLIAVILLLLIGFVIVKSHSTSTTSDLPSASAVVATSSAPPVDSSQHVVAPVPTPSASPPTNTQSTSTATTTPAAPTQSHSTATHPAVSATASSHPDSSANVHHAGDVPSGAL